jgi:hypothetical protein
LMPSDVTSKSELLQQFNETISVLERQIDPFELHVIASQLSANLQRARSSLSTILTLLSSKEPLLSVRSNSNWVVGSGSSDQALHTIRIHSLKTSLPLLSLNSNYLGSGEKSMRKVHPSSMPSLTWMAADH